MSRRHSACYARLGTGLTAARGIEEGTWPAHSADISEIGLALPTIARTDLAAAGIAVKSVTIQTGGANAIGAANGADL